MEFYEVFDQVIVILQRHGRVSSRALKRQFNIEDDFIEDLKDELLHSRHPITEEDDKSLVWTSERPEPDIYTQPETDRETRFHAALPVVMLWLQHSGRVTYRTLKHACGLDDELLSEIREELLSRQVATDEAGKILVWTGERSFSPASAAIDSRHPAPTEALQDESAVIAEAVRSVPEAERRQLTVMFCDLVGSTDLSGKLGIFAYPPEKVYFRTQPH